MSRTGFLGRLADDDVAALFALGRERRFRARSVLFFEGDDAHDVFVVLTGDVKVALTSADGREVVLDVVGAGDILGELSAIDGGPRSATATALGEATALVVPLGDFNQFVAARSEVAVTLLRLVAARLRDSSRRQLEFGAVDALGRVCARLVEMLARYGEGAGERVVRSPFSQQDLAGWAGLSREAVVKALHAMRSLGWISMEGRAIRVLDEDAVRARARSTSPDHR
jgi:CRP/FNR family transcriptional regulator, cyclic AMP receptor protein